MESALISATAAYDSLMSNPDPRTKDWLLISSPLPTLAITAAYLLVVFGGRRFMAKREPFALTGVVALYNVAMVAFNAYIAFEMIYNAYILDMSLVCAPMDRSSDPHSARIANAVWLYYISKSIEFLDTIFFMLRKKESQITFLHVYHHATMFPIWWIAVRWAAGGHSIYSAAPNSVVHVVMYTYYLLSGLGVNVWWKKYLTQIQLTQFFYVLGNTFLALYSVLYMDCKYNLYILVSLILYTLSMVILFSAFYIKEYTQKKKQRQSVRKAQAEEADKKSS